jgi:hypothetical protein
LHELWTREETIGFRLRLRGALNLDCQLGRLGVGGCVKSSCFSRYARTPRFDEVVEKRMPLRGLRSERFTADRFLG